MISELKVGPQVNADGAQVVQRASRTGATVCADAHGRYQEAVLRGNVYQLVVNGAAVTAFTGGAAGTPAIGIYNPANSGKNLIVLAVGISSRVAASAAGTVAFGLWGAPSAAPTGTLTAPTNLLSLAATGSIAKGTVNAAQTSAGATVPILPLASYYWATAASAVLAASYFDVAGLAICAQGNLVNLGGTAALTSATWDLALVWEEVPA